MIGRVLLAVAALGGGCVGQSDVPLALWVPYRAAVDHRAAGQYDAAERLLDLVIEKAPRCVSAWTLRGLTRIDRGGLAAGVADLDAALRIDPNHTDARIGRAVASLRAGDLAAAESDYRQALTADSTLGDARWGLGWIAEQRHDLVAALEQYDAWVTAEPQRVEAWDARAGVEQRLGQLPRARDDLQHALELAPDDAQRHWRLALVLQELEDVKGAIEQYQATLALDPSAVDCWLQCSAAQALRRHYADALTAAERAVELAPGRYATLWRRAYARMCMGDFAGSVADYDAAVALAPTEIDLVAERGHARQGVGDYAGAIEDFTRVLDARPGDASALGNRGHARWQHGDLPAAADDFEAAGHADPAEASNWAFGGWIRLQLGETAAALQDFEQAPDAEPGGRIATLLHRGRARALARLGRFDAALAALAEVQPTDVEAVECRLDAAVIAADAGDWATALHAWDRFVAGVVAYHRGGWPRADDPASDVYMQALSDAGSALARKDPEAACAAVERAVQARPTAALPRVVRARALRAASDLAAAVREMAAVEVLTANAPVLLRERAALFEALGDDANARMDRERADRLEQRR